MLLLGILLEGVVAVAVFAQSNDTTSLDTAVPLHPVAGSFKPNDVKLATCDDGDHRCIEQAFGNIAFHSGAKVALARFDALYRGFTDPNCHRVAHAIGSATLARNNGDVARTFAQGSPSCFSGYYHGVLERALIGVRGYDPGTLGKVARSLCSQIDTKPDFWLRLQCLHGMGHGLMITTGYTLPLSLKVCDQLATSWERPSCYGGAFMENVTNFYGIKSRWLRDDDPEYPCDVVAEKYKSKCYGISTARILRVDGGDWPKTAEICSTVEKKWVSTCFWSLGRDSAGQAHEDPEGILAFCALARPYQGESSCIRGAAQAMTANFKSGKQAAVLCRVAPAASQGGCYFGAGYLMAMYSSNRVELEAECRAVAAAARGVESCTRGGVALFRFVNRS